MKSLLIAVLSAIIIGTSFSLISAQEWTDYNQHDPGMTTAIPAWVDNSFRWYVDGAISQQELLTSVNWLLDNNYMHLSDKAAKEVDTLKTEHSDALREINDLRTELTSVRQENIELRKTLGSKTEMLTDQITHTKSDAAGKLDTSIDESPPEEVAFYFNKISFASDTIDNILGNGGAASDWSKGITAFSKHGMSDSTVDDLQKIVVLCNTQVSKKAQAIDSELNIIGQWLDIIEKNQAAQITTDPTTGSTDSSTTSQYRESDLDFIERRLASIDQQIISLDTGVTVMKDKLSAIGDDAQMANIDLQNSLQKQQQTLQTLSNISKNQHDTLKSIIQNMRA